MTLQIRNVRVNNGGEITRNINQKKKPDILQ